MKKVEEEELKAQINEVVERLKREREAFYKKYELSDPILAAIHYYNEKEKEKRLKKELEQIKKRTEKEEEEYMKKMDLDKESIDEHYAFLLELIKRDQAEANKK